MKTNARDTLIDTALRLFYADGFHAVGIDRILAEAGVSKMTLYKYFPSKEDLILAVLDHRDRLFRDWLTGRTEDLANVTGASPLLCLFDALAEWFADPKFHGCLFINASAEWGQADHPIRLAAARHKQLVADWLRQLAHDAGASDPDVCADQWMILMEGAIVLAQVMGRIDAEPLKQMAKMMMVEASIVTRS